MLNLLKPFFKLKKEFDDIKTGSETSSHFVVQGDEMAALKNNSSSSTISSRSSANQIRSTMAHCSTENVLLQPKAYQHEIEDRHLTPLNTGIPNGKSNSSNQLISKNMVHSSNALQRDDTNKRQQSTPNHNSQHRMPLRSHPPTKSTLPSSCGELRRKNSESMLNKVFSFSHRKSFANDVINSPRMTSSFHSTHRSLSPQQQQPLQHSTSSMVKKNSEKDFESRSQLKYQESIPFADDEIVFENEQDLFGVEKEVFSMDSRGGDCISYELNNRLSSMAEIENRSCNVMQHHYNGNHIRNDMAVEIDCDNSVDVRSNRNYALRRALYVTKDKQELNGNGMKNNFKSPINLGPKVCPRSRKNGTVKAHVANNNNNNSGMIQRCDYGRHSLKLNVQANTHENEEHEYQYTKINKRKTDDASLFNNYENGYTATNNEIGMKPIISVTTNSQTNTANYNKNENSIATTWQCRNDYESSLSLAEAKARAGGLSILQHQLENSRFYENKENGPSNGGLTLGRNLIVDHQDKHAAFNNNKKSAFSPVGTLDLSGISSQRYAYENGGGVASYRSKSAAILIGGNTSFHRASPNSEAYDSLMVSSILQLSRKLRRCSDEILQKLRRSRQLSRTPSPIADLLSQSSGVFSTTPVGAGSSTSLHRVGSTNTTTAIGSSSTNGMSQSYRCNAELHDSLVNLKAVEYQLQCVERTLFPQIKSGRSSAIGSCSEDDYLAQLERINHELRGFITIEKTLTSAESFNPNHQVGLPLSHHYY